MKKKVYAARLGVTALALTLVTTCLMGSTLARYVTEVTGSATATVAEWSFKVNGQAEKFTIDLGRTAYTDTTIADKVIAPGTSGSFKIEIDGSGSEVGIDYEIKLKAAADTTFPDDMVFSTKAITDANPGENFSKFIETPVEGSIDYSAAMKETVTIYWAWPLDGGADKDAKDTAMNDKDLSIDITVTGKQAAPIPTPASAS